MLRTLSVLALAFVPTAALAQGEPFYWDPTETQAASKLFAQAAELQGSAVDRAETAMQKADAVLASTEVALGFAGGFAGAEASAPAQRLFEDQSAAFSRAAATIQARVDEWSEGTRQAFLTAVSEALFGEAEARSVEKIEQCDSGPAGFAMGPRACKGTNVSAAVAGRIDANAELKTFVDGLAQSAPALEVFELSREPQAAVGPEAAAGWFDPVRLLEEVDVLREVLDRLDRFRGDIVREAEAELRKRSTPEVDPAERMAAVDEVQAAMDARLAGLNGLVGRVAESVAKRTNKGPQYGVCVFAKPGWGGCSGPDQTELVIAALSKDRGLAAAVRKVIPDSAP
jgi:hypothetical protein